MCNNLSFLSFLLKKQKRLKPLLLKDLKRFLVCSIHSIEPYYVPGGIRTPDR